MAARDCVATLLVVAEARGRPVLAGLLDALSDLASIGVTLVGAGQVLEHGWSAHTFLILGAMMLVSFLGTIAWTQIGRRIETRA